MDQLDKLLALADSSHDAEAVAAVRKARQLLLRGGISFADLARAAQKSRTRAFSLFSGGGGQVNVEMQLQQLRQRLDELQSDMQTQAVQVEFWRRRSAEFEQSFHTARSDAERWRRLTRETVERLWDLGQDIQLDDSNAIAEKPPTQKTA